MEIKEILTDRDTAIYLESRLRKYKPKLTICGLKIKENYFHWESDLIKFIKELRQYLKEGMHVEIDVIKTHPLDACDMENIVYEVDENNIYKIETVCKKERKLIA